MVQDHMLGHKGLQGSGEETGCERKQRRVTAGQPGWQRLKPKERGPGQLWCSAVPTLEARPRWVVLLHHSFRHPGIKRERALGERSPVLLVQHVKHVRSTALHKRQVAAKRIWAAGGRGRHTSSEKHAL